MKFEMCDNWYHGLNAKFKCSAAHNYVLCAALQEAVCDDEEQTGLHWYCKRCNRACVELHKSKTLISKEQGFWKKRMVKVENVLVEM